MIMLSAAPSFLGLEPMRALSRMCEIETKFCNTTFDWYVCTHVQTLSASSGDWLRLIPELS